MNTAEKKESKIEKSPGDLSFFTNLKIELIGTIGAAFLKTLALTWRWKFLDPIDLEKFWIGPGPRIFVSWHGRQLITGPLVSMCTRAQKNRPSFVALISRHADGRIAAKVMHSCGIDSVAGSSTRGAIEGGRKLIATLMAGKDIGLTPDGPKGPNQQCKEGVIRIAQLTGATIYPLAGSANRHWRFKSWDKMMLPKPFACVYGVRAAGLKVPRHLTEAEVKEYVAQLDNLMNQATQLVDNAAGVPIII